MFDGASDLQVTSETLRSLSVANDNQSLMPGRELSGQLTSLPLAVRRELLKEIIKGADKDRLDMVSHKLVKEPQCGDLSSLENNNSAAYWIEAAYQQAMRDGYEGLVVKSLQDSYTLAGGSAGREAYLCCVVPVMPDVFED